MKDRFQPEVAVVESTRKKKIGWLNFNNRLCKKQLIDNDM